MKQEWKFNGAMDCDKCKWGQSCTMVTDCPYLAGWEDGQRKLLRFEIANTDTVQLKDTFKLLLTQLEAKHG